MAAMSRAASLDRARRAGYDHALLADSKFARLGTVIDRYFANVKRVRSAVDDLGIALVPALFPVGYSNARLCTGLLQQSAPSARILVWSDMFDPLHNAIDNYYLVNGNLKGAWDGLDKPVVIMNWNFGHRDESLRFFAAQRMPWRESRTLSGEIGEHIVMARQAADGRWLVGAATDESPRELDIPLSFLPAGPHQALVIEDGDDSDYRTHRESYKPSQRVVTNRDTVRVKLAPGGGACLLVTPQSP